MSGLAELEIIRGVAASISLSTEGASPHRGPSVHRRTAGLADEVVNVMRISLRDSDGKTQDFDFRNTTVHVREGQEIAVVRARRSGVRQPLVLMLVNRSNGQRDEFPDGLRRAASQKGWPARLRALLGAVPIALVTFLVSHYVSFSQANLIAAIGLAGLLGFGSFFALWAGLAFLDQIRLPGLERAEVQRLKAELHARLFEPPAPPAPPAPKPADAPPLHSTH